MSKIEIALAIASGVGETFDKAREMIGTDQLALFLAKAASESLSLHLSPTKVAKATGRCRNTAISAIEAVMVK